ncbi:MAG: alcohol dehydrogenase catalytic domain-containing protein [Chloroflexi bacterium AL-W]|nr:alcohol dehydrogenase catalytic domain-containing protein [Chloroflexi bacterium AL-N1]NOK70579.1 alcohol dehydrogenase catalytic domain-containing protein [Chloroflexi bacterium AL-N10]NOK77571.1 alcohol dehydrogenase catalytic domain-containing protein [Chloroflexi bacterium AL-N5]NOK84422.1 alcohol dehydrogenase catalytic domain-containing protein [Chloroflexi bacterium AL-W]NOK92311.1 alcohol dehydrogenase catalytic domain-containing protein [Chloroflexi bacterium AL-N15]
MLALLFDKQLRLVSNYPEPNVQPNEALIRPHLVGICNTDIEITRGYKDFCGILGHEFVGTVVACADPQWMGVRVVGEINSACQQCDTCRRGDTSHCISRTTLGINGRDGAMAERFSLPIACLHAVPSSMPDEAAIFVEPLAAALEILEETHLRPSDRVAVVGDGKLGLLCAQVLRLPGCDVTVVGRHPERWETLHTRGIRTITKNSEQFDVVVDCTGQPDGFVIASQLVRPRGRLILKSTFASEASVNLSTLVVNEIRLIGSRCGPFAPALRLLEQGLVDTRPLIAKRYTLRHAINAFQAVPNQLKILLEV